MHRRLAVFFLSFFFISALVILSLFITGKLHAFNLRPVDRGPGGFEIYRSGFLNNTDIMEICKKGVDEILVLSGDGERLKKRLAFHCPRIKIISDENQTHSKPLTAEFLKRFDAWIVNAKQNGKKILFRCMQGYHRAGRLAAYYQMKHQGIEPEDAVTLMRTYGKILGKYKSLDRQVYALSNYINGEKCSQKERYCVTVK